MATIGNEIITRPKYNTITENAKLMVTETRQLQRDKGRLLQYSKKRKKYKKKNVLPIKKFSKIFFSKANFPKIFFL